VLPLKKIRPGFPRPDPIQRGVHPAALPSWFHIVTVIKTTLLCALRKHSSLAYLVSDRLSVTGLDGALRL
jgi:hypothetical protein